MVHALEEVWRVLERGGWLVDVRPVPADWPLEVLIDGRPSPAGCVDGSPKKPDQLAADEAIAQVIRRGMFEQEERAFFEYAYYWPSVEAMQAHIAGSWTWSAVLPQPVLAEARRLVKSTGAQSEIKVRRQMEITRYRRLEQ